MTREGFSRREFLERSGLLFCGLLGAPRLLAGCEVHEVVPRISGGLRRFVTPVEGVIGEEFYIQFGNPSTNVENVPQLSPDQWSLAVTGLVDNPVTITYADVVAAAESEGITFLKTMRCVLDAPAVPLISNGYWRGVPLSRFLMPARPRGAGVRARFTAEDGFTNNLKLTRILNNVAAEIGAEVPVLPVMLALELNGEPIPALHGGPVRLIVPEKFGYKNMKFPRELEVTDADEPFGVYEVDLFEGSPIADLGNMDIVSMFSGPVEGEGVAGPSVTLFGIALHGRGGIERVEVEIDGGAFAPAQVLSFDEVLADPVLFFGEDTSARRSELAALRETLVQAVDPAFADLKPWVWSLWRFETELPSGRHEARVRAFGTDGAEQGDTDTVGDNGDSRIRRVRFSVE